MQRGGTLIAGVALLLCIGLGNAALHYRVTGHHKDIKHTGRLIQLDRSLSDTLRDLFGSSFISSEIEKIEKHSLSPVSPSTTVFHAILTFSGDITRDRLLETVNHDNNVDTLRFFKVSKGSLSPVPFRPSFSSFLGGLQPEILSAACSSDHGIQLPNGTCVCDPFFAASDCSEIICSDGVQADSKQRCICPPGRFSANCEPKECVGQVEDNIRPNTRALIFVISLKSTMARDLNDLIPRINASVRSVVDQNAGLYSSFGLVTFLSFNGNVVIDTLTTPSLDEFTGQLEEIAISKGDDSQPSINAIESALNVEDIRPKSSIIFFGDSLPMDTSPYAPEEISFTAEKHIIEQAIAWGHKISLVITDTETVPLNKSAKSYESYQQVAVSTHGDLISLWKTNVGALAESLIPILTINENLLYLPEYYCGNEVNAVLTLDQAAANYYVIISGTGTVHVKSTTSDEITVDPTTDINGYTLFTVDATMNILRIIGPQDKKCSVRVFLQTKDTVFYSFARDNKVDAGRSWTTSEVSHQLTFSAPSTVTTLSVDVNQRDGSLLETVELADRANPDCAFSFLGAMTTTCQPGPYSLKINAGNADGFLFSRHLPAFCEKPAERTVPVFTCQNGGTVIQNGDGSPGCDCTGLLFSGNNCEVPICQNGGTANQFPGGGQPMCLCVTGWSGDHCEALTSCNNKAVRDFDLNKRALVIAVQASFTQQYTSEYIVAGLQALTQEYALYVLTAFNTGYSNGVASNKITTSTTTDKQAFMDSFSTVKYQLSASDSQDVVAAVSSSFGTLLVNNITSANIIVVTDSKESSTAAQRKDFISQALTIGAINIVHTPKFEDITECSLDEDLPSLAQLAKYTGGLFTNLCKNYDSGNLGKFVTGIAAHPPNHDILDVYSSATCTSDGYDLSYENREDMLTTLSINTEGLTDDLVINVQMGDSEVIIRPNVVVKLPYLSVYSLPSAPEKYTVTVNSPTATPCIMLLNQVTNDHLRNSFTIPGPLDAAYDTPFYGYPLSPVLHVLTTRQNAVQPAATVSVMNLDGVQTYTSQAGATRANCTFELLWTERFSCPQEDTPFVFKSSITYGDVPLKRAAFMFCSLRAQCVNGAANDDGSCDCGTSGYEGTRCEVPICKNGAQQVNNVCVCPQHYAGVFCEYTQCETYDILDFHDPRQEEFKSVTLVFESTKNMIVTNTMFKSVVDQFVTTVDAKGTPKQFSVMTYDDKVVRTLVSTSIARHFSQAVQDILSGSWDQTPDTTVAFTATNEAIELAVPAPAIIFIFVSTKSTDISQFLKLLQQHQGVQVNIIFSPFNTPSPYIPTSSPFYLYNSVAYLSGGRTLPIQQMAAFDAANAFASMVEENTLFFSEGIRDCAAGQTYTFPVDYFTKRLVINILGKGIARESVVILNPAGAPVVLAGDVNLFYDQSDQSSTYIAQFDSKTYDLPGTWTVTVTNAGACHVEARGVSSFKADVGFTTDPYSDNVKDLPFSAQATNPSAYLTIQMPLSLSVLGAVRFTTVAISTLDPTYGTLTQRQVVDINLRDPKGCSYQFISNNFTMPTRDSHSQFVITGVDQNQNTVQRVFVFATNRLQDCANGNKDAYGQCECSPGYGGDACDISLCANGGTSSGALCICQSGYQGPHCEDIITPNIITTSTASTESTSTATTQAGDDESSSSSTTTVTSTTTPHTTTIPNCDLPTTNYDIVFFVDSTAMNIINYAQGAVGTLSTRFGLDQGLSQTFFQIDGVNGEYLPEGIKTTPDAVNQAFEAIKTAFGSEPPTDLTSFMLGNAITQFMAGGDFNQFTVKPAFAVIIASKAITDDVTTAAQALKDQNFNIVGMATTAAALQSLQTITDYVRQVSNQADGAQYISDTICAMKPL